MTLQVQVSGAPSPMTDAEKSDVLTTLGAVSTAALTAHAGSTSNPHGVTKTQVGLGNVDNTADTAKPVSAAQALAIESAVSAHEAAADPHPGYLTPAEADAAYAPIGASGVTNLSATASPTGVTVASDTGADATLPAADATNAGLMLPAQVTKLSGIADGATANATDAQLRDRATHTGTQATSTITGLDAALAGKADLVGGKLSASQVPDIALVQYLGAVASQPDMLALTGQAGDWCTRTDTGTTFIITGSPSLIGGWTQLSYPAAPVTSVAGRTGAVTIAAADVSDSGAAGRDLLRMATLSEIQASVSGGHKILLQPSGDTTFAADSIALNVAASSLVAIGGGVIEFAPGVWYIKDHQLRSGVAYLCESLPNLATDEVCADLGLSDTNPFPGGAVFKGTGTETVFTANETARVAASAMPDPADKPVTGVRIERLVGWNIATLVRCGATDHNGLAFSTLRDLYGFAIKGRFLDLRNIQHVNGGNFKAIDAKHTLYICNDHSACQTGNSHFSDIYGYSWAEPAGSTYPGKGTDWQIKLECTDTGRNFGGNLLNYITLNGRIQCNNFRDTVLDRTRGNAQIVLQGAGTGKTVNVCEINGTDMEGHTTYGLRADWTTGCRVKTNGASNYADTVATIKVKNSLNFVIDSNTYDTTVWLDAPSSAYLSGYVRYYAYDSTEATLPLSQMAKGLYTLFAAYASGTTSPVYAALGGGNGQTMVQLGTSNSYSMSMSENDNVLRLKLIPIADQLTPISANKTWGRWEASTVLLSGAATTQTLPVIDSKMDGVSYVFRATDSNSHTIVGQSGQLIDGAGSYPLPANGCVKVTAVDAGAKWIVTGKF